MATTTFQSTVTTPASQSVGTFGVIAGTYTTVWQASSNKVSQISGNMFNSNDITTLVGFQLVFTPTAGNKNASGAVYFDLNIPSGTDLLDVYVSGSLAISLPFASGTTINWGGIVFTRNSQRVIITFNEYVMAPGYFMEVTNAKTNQLNVSDICYLITKGVT